MRVTNGFTIIELLVVVVVIGILASITIVSYNGITQRANTTTALAAANNVVKKILIYNAETGTYPYATTDLTNDPTASYYVPGTIAYDLGTTAPASANVVRFVKCGSGSPASQSAINSGAGNITGVRVYYWTYTGTPNADSYQSAGVDTGSGIACPSS